MEKKETSYMFIYFEWNVFLEHYHVFTSKNVP